MIKSAWITPRLEIISVNNKTLSGESPSSYEYVGTYGSYYTANS